MIAGHGSGLRQNGAARPQIVFSDVSDFAQFGETWRDLETRAKGSFFQSWAWVGCLAERRFTAPMLLRAEIDGRVAALALFNRARTGPFGLRRSLFLAESGDAGWDSVFIEHNDILAEDGGTPSIRHACWEALSREHPTWHVSGIDRDRCSAFPEEMRVKELARRPAPRADFTRYDPTKSVLDHLSANTRQQIRRSLRAWEAIGPVSLQIAQTQEEAQVYLDQLTWLHQRYWTGRGKAGAFAEPKFVQFHQALLERAGPGQSVDLLRVRAGNRDIGFLYNLIHHGWVNAYQSGFAFDSDADKMRPGLVCHLLAMDHYRRQGMRIYDFMGGEARYKRSFANDEIDLVWLQVNRRRMRLPECRASHRERKKL